MKCHKFLFLAYKDVKAFMFCEMSPQNGLYIPNKGILGYGIHNKDKIDFFFDGEKAVEQGEKAISGKLKGSEYLGTIEIPDNQINELIENYKTKIQLEEEFQKKSKTLISLLS